MKIIDTFVKENYDKVIGWGSSKYFYMIYPKINIQIEYLIDSDSSRHGKRAEKILIFGKEILKKENPKRTLIIVFSSFYNEICDTINQYGEFFTISGMQFERLYNFLYIKNPSILEDSEKDKGIIISISRNNFSLVIGGTSKFIGEQMKIINNENYINIHLFWESFNIKGNYGDMVTIVKNGMELGLYRLEDFFREIKNIKSIIIHNLIGMEFTILNRIINNVKHDVSILYYIHDFSCICSSINLLYNNKDFCKAYENNWEKCFSCIHKKQKEIIYNYHQKLFKKENIKIIAPSVGASKIITKSFNISKEKINIIEHQNYIIKQKNEVMINEKIKIAYVGYKSTIKGWDIFKKIVIHFKDNYEFYCLGSSDEILSDVKYVDVSFIEDGENAMINAIIHHRIDVALLWSLCPETYSYTYYESFAGGALVLTNSISGNIADQVSKNNNGVVLKDYNELHNLLQNVKKLRGLIKKNNRIIKSIKFNKEFLNIIKYPKP